MSSTALLLSYTSVGAPPPVIPAARMNWAELFPRGGSDVWDNVQAAPILKTDAFKIPVGVEGVPPTYRTSVKKLLSGTTTGITTVTGDTIIVAATSPVTEDPSTPTDSYTNTWTLVVNFDDSSSRIKVWICSNATGGAGHTFTSSASTGVLFVVAYSGAAVSSLDADTLKTMPASTGPITTAGTIDVPYSTVITVLLPLTGGFPSYTCNTGYTIRVEEVDNTAQYGGAVADKNIKSTAAQAATWVVTGGADNIAVIFCIKGT